MKFWGKLGTLRRALMLGGAIGTAVAQNWVSAQSTDDIAGYFTATVNVSASGNAKSTVSSEDGTLTQEETYSCTLTSRARYVVRWIGEGLISEDEVEGSASASVSGNGTMTVTSKSGTQTGTWTYKLSPNFDGSQSYLGAALDTAFNFCEVSANYPASTSSSPEGLSPWGMANDMAYEAFRKANEISFQVPTNMVAWSYTQSKTGNATWPFGNAEASGAATITATVAFEPGSLPKWEAAISFVPVGGTTDYDSWLPLGGTDEDNAGTHLFAMVRIKAPDGSSRTPPKAKFTLSLENVSAEPGVGMNFPAKDQAKNSKDLKLAEIENLQVADDGQSAESRQNEDAVAVEIKCFDYGAYGQLKVTAETEDGQTLVAYLEGHPGITLVSIPKDENENHIADAWEKQMGIFELNLAEDWDEVNFPKDQKTDGDGIGLYERYRGFKFQEQYERLAVTNKYVFVYDPDDAVKSLALNSQSRFSSFPVVSQCRTRYVSDGEWTGHGRAAAQKRIVNFNTSGFGHAVDQHAITVQQVMEESPLVPPDWDDMWKTNHAGASWGATNSLQGTLGMTWPDYSTTGFDSPKNTFLITVYPAGVNREIRTTVYYHTWGLPAYTNFSDLTTSQQTEMRKAVEKAADEYIKANPTPKRQRYYQRLSDVTTHEMGHSLGVSHHDPTTSGEQECVMRYFSWDHPRNPNDRFELTARTPWPDIYCRSANHTANARGCWYQIKVTDK